MHPTVAAIVVLAASAIIVWKFAMRGRGDAKFTIDVSGPGIDGVKMKGAVPGRSASEVCDFVARLELPAGAKIWGVPDRGRLRLEFAGDIPDNVKQRLRNFFYN